MEGTHPHVTGVAGVDELHDAFLHLAGGLVGEEKINIFSFLQIYRKFLMPLQRSMKIVFIRKQILKQENI